MEKDDQTRGIMSQPRAFVPVAGALLVLSGWGFHGRSVPISLAACSYKP
jgi:hypothetical protein